MHSGEILRDDFLQPMKISVYALAQAIKARHDLEAADRKLRRRIAREVRPRAA